MIKKLLVCLCLLGPSVSMANMTGTWVGAGNCELSAMPMRSYQTQVDVYETSSQLFFGYGLIQEQASIEMGFEKDVGGLLSMEDSHGNSHIVGMTNGEILTIDTEPTGERRVIISLRKTSNDNMSAYFFYDTYHTDTHPVSFDCGGLFPEL